MKNILRSAFCGTAVGVIGLVACDAAPPPNVADTQRVTLEEIPPSETLVDVVRAALADIVRDKDPYARARRLGTLLPTLGADSVPALTQTLDDLVVDLKATDIDLLVRRWATFQPEAAAHWAKDVSPLNYRSAALYSALSQWAEADPKAAIDATWAWAEMPNFDSVVPVALVRGWYASNDPPELRQYLRSIPADILGQRAIAAYIRVVIETKGTEAAQRWAESLPDGEGEDDDKAFKLAAFRRVVDILSQLDIEAAIRWCDTHCSDPFGTDMRSLIARNWVLYDGPAAMAWLSTARPGTERDFCVFVSYGLWSRTARKEAMAWMASQTPAAELDSWLQPAFPVYARLLAGDAPAEAMKYAERIKEAREREVTMIGVARVWRHLDEAAAEKWLAQSPFSEEALASIRAPIPEGKQPNL